SWRADPLAVQQGAGEGVLRANVRRDDRLRVAQTEIAPGDSRHVADEQADATSASAQRAAGDSRRAGLDVHGPAIINGHRAPGDGRRAAADEHADAINI